MSEEEKDLQVTCDEADAMAVQPTQETEMTTPDKPKKGGKLLLFIGLATAVVAVAVGVAVAITAMASPLKLVGTGISNSAAAWEKNSVVSFLGEVADGGSVEVLCDLETLAELPPASSLSLKLFNGGAKAALVADVVQAGEGILDAGLFVDEDSVAVNSETLFGTAAYGTLRADFAERFDRSVFGPNGEFSLGLEFSEEDLASYDTKQLEKDSETILADMGKRLSKSVRENVKVTKERDSLRFGDETVAVTAVDLRADGKGVAAFLIDMLTYIRDDAALKQYMYEYAEYVAPALLKSDLVYLDAMDYKDAEVIDAFYATLEEIDVAELEELEEEDMEIGLICYVTDSGKELVGMKLVAEADGERVSASFQTGPTWEDLKEFSFRVDDGYSVIRMDYTVETNNKSEFVAKWKTREDDEVVGSGEFTWDKRLGGFTLNVTDDWGDTYRAYGGLQTDGKSAKLTLDLVAEDTYETELGISVILNTKDEMPAMPDYEDVLEMDEGEVEDLLCQLQDTLSALNF